MWVDFTKCGTLQSDCLDDTLEEARRLCAAYSNKACAVVIAPAMTSSRVIGGKRGEVRLGSLHSCSHANCSLQLQTSENLFGAGESKINLIPKPSTQPA